MDLFEKIKTLRFSPEQYVVIGGSAMEAYGIRKARDIDILVDLHLFRQCKDHGWEEMPWTKPGKEGKTWLKKDGVDLYSELVYSGENLFLGHLKNRITYIHTIPFISVDTVLDFKKEAYRLWSRPKDLEDIGLVEAYVRAQQQLQVQ